MILINVFYEYNSIPKEHFSKLLLILAPFAPFISEELWSKIGNDFSIHQQQWPEFDESIIALESVCLAIQINGKTRGTIEVEKDEEETGVIEKVENDERLKNYLGSKNYKKIIYVKNKIINFII